MKRVAKVVRQRVRRTHKYVGRYVKGHAKIVKHAKRRVRKRHNAAALKDVEVVKQDNAEIHNVEIYNADIIKMTVNKQK